jgi:hypothetical protein
MADNKIQIKRSVANGTVTGLSNGELAFTQASNTLHIGLPDGSGVLRIGGAMVPGTLTANQALVANSTSGINKVITANLVANNIWANGAAGTAGDVLTSNGTVVYWRAPSSGVAGSDTQVQFNDGGSLSGDSGLTFNKTTDTFSTNNVLATSTVNAATLSVGSSVVANSSRLVVGTAVGVQANGTIGTAGQVLHSNGTTIYWATTASSNNVTFSNVVTSNLSVTGRVSSNLMPLANNTYHLGNTSIKWAQVHAANVHGVTGIFDGNVQIAGDLIVAGNVTTTNVSSLVVADAKILLAANNPGDILDIGFSGTYTDGGSTVRHAGLFRDASDNGLFKFFSNTVQNLSGNNVIDTNEASYAVGRLQTYLNSSGLSTNSSVTNITANSTVSVSITANTLTLTTALIGTSGGTGKSTMTSEAILVGNTSNGYKELTLGTAGFVLQSNGTALEYSSIDGGVF